MSVLTTTAGGPAGILRNYWKQQLLDILRNNLLAGDLCDVQVIPANSGNVIEFHRINSFSKQVTGISEFFGYMTFANLKGKTFTVDSVVYGLEPIGNDIELTEKTIMTAEPNPVPTLTDRFLYNAKDTIDQRLINIMVSNVGNTQSSTAPSVTYFGASVSTAITWGDGSATLTEATLDAGNPSHRIAAETFNTAYTALKSRSAKPPTGRKRFASLLAPEIAGDLRTDGTFQDIAEKGFQKGEDKFENALIGSVFGVDVMEDENVSINTAGTVNSSDQIVRCPVVGDGYVARISYAKGIGVPQINYLPPGKADKADPYGMVGILVWKSYAATGGVLNPLAGQLIKVATTRAKSTSQDDDSVWNV